MPLRETFADIRNVPRPQLRMTSRFASGQSPRLDIVSTIIFLSARRQMLRIAARGIMTKVTNDQSGDTGWQPTVL